MSGIVIVVVMVKHGGVTSQQTASDSGHSWSFSEDSPSVHCKAFHSALKPPFSPSRFVHRFPVHGLSVSTPNVTIPLLLLCACSSLSYLQNRNRGKRSAFKVLIPPTSWASVSITLVPWERHPHRPVSLSIWPPPSPVYFSSWHLSPPTGVAAPWEQGPPLSIAVCPAPGTQQAFDNVT